MMKRWRVAVVIAALLPFAGRNACGELVYTVTDLGFIGSALGINNKGQVVGYAGNHPYRAFVWQSGSGMQDLGTFGGSCSQACRINDHGQMAGWADTSPYNTMQAFLYTGGAMQKLGANSARSINDSGQVVGDGLSGGHAFLYSDGIMHDIGTLPGGYNSTARGINSSGQIVGDACDSNWVERAFLYSNGSMQDIGTLAAPYNYGGCAQDINDSGQVVGYAVDSSYAQRAFLYSNGVMHDLGTLGRSSSAAFGINEKGQVVGECAQRAFLYSDSVMVDLNTLISPSSGWSLLEATDINDNGQIVGYGITGGALHPFLLTPTPEPSSLVLLGIGIASLIVYIWRRQGQTA